MKDRNYYRMMPDSELVEESIYGTDTDWKELAIVLAERLREARDTPPPMCPHCDD